MHQPKEAHLQATTRIVQYLKGTPRREIFLKQNKSASLEANTDADYAGQLWIGEQLLVLHLPWWKPGDLEE